MSDSSTGIYSAQTTLPSPRTVAPVRPLPPDDVLDGHEIWRHIQRGLIHPSPYALFATFWRQAGGVPISRALLSRVMSSIQETIQERHADANTTAVVGVGFPLWREICEQEGIALPTGMALLFPAESAEDPAAGLVSAVFERSHGTFADSQADLWFHLKSDRDGDCRAVFDLLSELLAAEDCVDASRTVSQDAATKSVRPDKLGGKVLGCRFSENLNNPTDPVTIEGHTIVGNEDPPYAGSSFVLAQRFAFNWEHILNMGPDQIEDLVGRTAEDVIVPSRDERSHIKCSRAQDDAGDTMRILRLGLPYGTSSAVHSDDLRHKGASLRDEQGVYFAGYAKNVRVLESVMATQVGDRPGYMADRLLTSAHADIGGFYFVPNQTMLELEPTTLANLADVGWDEVPGMDWNRLDRHFTERSGNGYQYYNHRDYLFHMATMSGAERLRSLPPSKRVLRLLSKTFSRWQDNWYFDRVQPEPGHLAELLEREFDRERAMEIMSRPVMERMGWAVKLSLGSVFASTEYGFRGRRRDAEGNWVNGADTYHLDPLEIIVGGMPSLGLGQGKYVVDYTRDDEKLGHFFQNLSHASGVGHVVPDYQRLLDHGISGLIDDVAGRLAAAADEQKRQFYLATRLALEGVQAHCLAFADLAADTAAGLPASSEVEQRNLADVEARMRKLADGPPETLAEATQLIFTLHSCLHLIGEPTAIGRLDQLLQPFYDRDLALGEIDDDQAQEIIDCLWVKLGENVLWNRGFVDDNQPFGNMAMGGASGSYPQGGSNNQWVQQITVGGTVADDTPGSGRPAYNRLTMLCLRAARRLPLNAPCLSLRVRPDIPQEYLDESARALLSGGAHPILINDEKVIPGLVRSGEDIGSGSGPTEFTPVAEKAGERWRSTVPLSVARDYACDGCYEPQFVGKNWFTLGNVNTLQVLEATLNQGKSWLTAGPMYFRGQRVSFTSPKPTRISSFDEVQDLFFTHLSWMYAKQADGVLGLYGRMSEVCPSPLLSVFVDDCVEKGMDYYAGGARYNVLAPCFTGLSNTINSLYAVRHLVFDPATAVTSLPELVEALMCDWGESMVEPFTSSLAGAGRVAARAERFRDLREAALALPKYGRGHPEIDAFGNDFLQRMSTTVLSVFTDPAAPTARTMVELARRYGTAEHPFGLQLQPGVGTFENYLEFGAQVGASAEGRRSGEPLATDLSPTPSPGDRPVDHQEVDFLAALRSLSGAGTADFWDTAPTDFNIREEFDFTALTEILRAFCQGAGSNLLTVTCANPETFAAACRDPEKYDLLRVRMGGWSEFFISMFPGHQRTHERRPFSVEPKR
ncbi:Dyp-type peroxidase family [Actinoalloteichus hoggarensis]|uniref:4-hydroxyphenylacetate decarboxylase large subunit n=1 Tax=Actinoalloteichus hoggarensis TaxID=1470176 RepID=A0A221W3B7_9PSEU|nr:pyruvate formate lyase family protein [Actinoalloteichus hoggarensis]ASO20342.1 4-hydroxyphenylacetate decarboxylase large subunit [Actinoalloteichus hoggarensis]MBB5923380.1 Dyp-type peroxidase family [Actinoalloteichus hoggarensis]